MDLCKTCVRFENMSEKLLDEMTFKIGLDAKRRLQGLAEADGLTASELVRRLIDSHIEDRAANYRALHSIFGESRTTPKE
jgi:predicted DNA-binding protein